MTDLDAKRLDVFREAVAGLSHVALPVDPNVTEKYALAGVRASAEKLGLTTRWRKCLIPEPWNLSSPQSQVLASTAYSSQTLDALQ